MKKLICVACALLIFPLFASTQTVYKSVDETGHVTYSTTPPVVSVDMEAVTTAPKLTPKQIKQAEERAQQIKQKGEVLEAARMERERISKENKNDIQQTIEQPATTTIVGDADSELRDRIKQQIPATGNDPSAQHPVYNGKNPPASIQPVPRRIRQR